MYNLLPIFLRRNDMTFQMTLLIIYFKKIIYFIYIEGGMNFDKNQEQACVMNKLN